jgi:hypothetical protein
MTHASQYYARKRRRKKQDQKAFALAGIEPPPFRIITLAATVTGQGYTVGDEFLITGGTFSIQGRGYVVATNGVFVTAVAIQIAGAYTGSGPGIGAATVAQTGGGDNTMTVDVTLSQLFSFGATAAGGSSANILTLPADAKIALRLENTTVAAGGFGVEDVTDGITYVNAEGFFLGGPANIRKLFRVDHQIRITRAIGTPNATCIVYFRGPKTSLIEIGGSAFS